MCITLLSRYYPRARTCMAMNWYNRHARIWIDPYLHWTIVGLPYSQCLDSMYVSKYVIHNLMALLIHPQCSYLTFWNRCLSQTTTLDTFPQRRRLNFAWQTVVGLAKNIWPLYITLLLFTVKQLPMLKLS